MAFQILSLSGGGYRGLYTVSVLKHIEAQARRPLHECFDLITGTSIGGIIAIGLSMGATASDIENVFLEEGEKIFPSGEPPKGKIRWAISALKQSIAPKYDGKALRRAIIEVIGDEKVIGDAKTRLLIPTVNMTKGSVQMFKTPHHPSFVRDLHLKAVDVAMATSAAPTFFPLAKIGPHHFADGGLYANAPDMCAIHEAVHFCNAPHSDIKLLSIGTTTNLFSLPNSLGTNLGHIAWLKNQRLVSTIIASQQQLVDFMVGHQLGDRYLRIDRQPSNEQISDLGLDLATQEKRETLLALADSSYQDHAGKAELKSFLTHTATIPDYCK